MKGIFKYFACLLAAVMCVGLAAGLSACDFAGEGEAVGPSDIEISAPKYFFASAEEWEDPNFDFSTADDHRDLLVDTEYYARIDFDVTACKDNDGKRMFTIFITFDQLNVLKVTIEEVNTHISQTTVVDANTGQQASAKFRIPSARDEPKHYFIIVRMTPLVVGSSKIIIHYECDGEDFTDTANSSMGHTQNVDIIPVKIETPVLTYSESTCTLEWNHVKNADYYELYEGYSTEPLTDFEGKVIYVNPEAITVGNKTGIDLDAYLSPGTHRIRIRAFNNNPNNIIPSDYSEILEIFIP